MISKKITLSAIFNFERVIPTTTNNLFTLFSIAVYLQQALRSDMTAEITSIIRSQGYYTKQVIQRTRRFTIPLLSPRYPIYPVISLCKRAPWISLFLFIIFQKAKRPCRAFTAFEYAHRGLSQPTSSGLAGTAPCAVTGKVNSSASRVLHG